MKTFFQFSLTVFILLFLISAADAQKIAGFLRLEDGKAKAIASEANGFVVKGERVMNDKSWKLKILWGWITPFTCTATSSRCLNVTENRYPRQNGRTR